MARNCFIHRHNSKQSSLSCQAQIQAPRLQLRQISKRYPGCLANDDIDLSIAPAKSTPCSVKTARAKAR
jgi:hypothetical protein